MDGERKTENKWGKGGRWEKDEEEREKEREPTLLLHVVLCKHLKGLWTFDFRSHFCRRVRERTRGRGREGEGVEHSLGDRPSLLSITAICPVLREPLSFL